MNNSFFEQQSTCIIHHNQLLMTKNFVFSEEMTSNMQPGDEVELFWL